MMNVKEFINAIQKHPQMFVHEVRTDYIEYMISGFICGNLVNIYMTVRMNIRGKICILRVHLTE